MKKEEKEHLDVYFRQLRPILTKKSGPGLNEPFFVSLTGTKLRSSNMSHLITAYKDKLGIKKKMNCTQYRKRVTTETKSKVPEKSAKIARHLKHSEKTQAKYYNLTQHNAGGYEAHEFIRSLREVNVASLEDNVGEETPSNQVTTKEQVDEVSTKDQVEEVTTKDQVEEVTTKDQVDEVTTFSTVVMALGKLALGHGNLEFLKRKRKGKEHEKAALPPEEVTLPEEEQEEPLELPQVSRSRTSLPSSASSSKRVFNDGDVSYLLRNFADMVKNESKISIKEIKNRLKASSDGLRLVEKLGGKKLAIPKIVRRLKHEKDKIASGSDSN